jgi:hypothetical protein
MASFLEQLRQATGVDVAKVVGNLPQGKLTSDTTKPQG